MHFIPALKYDFLTPYYDKFLSFWLPDKAIRQKTIELAEIREGERILDFGCGTGTLLLRLADSYHKLNLVGYDVDVRILKIAKQKDIYNKVKWTNTFMSPNSERTYDVIFATWFFHHLDDFQKLEYLQKMKSLLNNGGRLIVVDWGKPANTLMSLLFFIVRVFDNFETFEMHKKGTFSQLFEKAGFKLEHEKFSQNTWFGTLKYWLIKA